MLSISRDPAAPTSENAPQPDVPADSYEDWDAAGSAKLVDEAREKVKQTLASHEPLPLDDDIDRELRRLHVRARESTED